MRKSPQVLQSAELALRLVLLVAQRGSITLSEAAGELEVAPSTAHRLLSTCKHVGYVSQFRSGGPYSPGPAIHELAMATAAAVDLRDAARPVLEKLRADTGETVSLLLLEGHRVRFVESLEGNHSVRVGSRLGLVVPAHLASGGKAMLADLSPEELLRRYPTQEPEMNWAGLMETLRVTRERGWGASFGDSDPNVGGIGAAIRSADGYPIAAVTMGAPLSRLGTEEQAAAFVPAVLEAQERIQGRLRGER